MKINKKLLTAGITILLISSTLTYLKLNQNYQQASIEQEQSITDVQKQTYTFTATEDKTPALLLAESQVKLNYEEYDFGIFIKSVNDLAADDNHYWAIYLNGDYAQTGISDITLNSGDVLELKFEEIQNAAVQQ